ncbi:MAG TPA: HD domain-containing phosphohydrolase [Bryobacteraceae bacterium]|nr:HD domain-containing phosphohydrolase [Bryobacteraceae bacterium]
MAALTTRILIVDDEAPIRALLGEHLQQVGHQVKLAANGGAALEMLADGGFDLVLTDVRMPGMNGLELLAEIIRTCPGVGVLMLTACEDLTLAVNAMRIGALDYILKPFRLAEITNSVREALQRRRNQIEQAQRMQLLEETVNERTVELRRMLDRLHDASEITLEALVAALDAREHETQAHSKRVSEYTLFLAREMGVDAAQLDVIRRGAMLHDIGKIGISDSILLKPGKLTDREWIDMQKHPHIGFWILDGIEALKPASDVVLSHHERYDGGGYPRKLSKSDIPLGARIFSVTDCLDVMTSDRPYRKALSYEQARNEILRFAGTQFDPDVVKYFLRVPAGIWTEIRNGTGRSKSKAALDLSNLLAETPAPMPSGG